MILDFSNERTKVFRDIKFYYYQLDFWAEDELFLSTQHISDKKWYIDFFAEKDYESWRLSEDKNSVYIIRRLFRNDENIGVAIAHIDLDELIKTVSNDYSSNTYIFAYVSNAPDILYVSDNDIEEKVSKK